MYWNWSRRAEVAFPRLLLPPDGCMDPQDEVDGTERGAELEARPRLVADAAPTALIAGMPVDHAARGFQQFVDGLVEVGAHRAAVDGSTTMAARIGAMVATSAVRADPGVPTAARTSARTPITLSQIWGVIGSPFAFCTLACAACILRTTPTVTPDRS